MTTSLSVLAVRKMFLSGKAFNQYGFWNKVILACMIIPFRHAQGEYQCIYQCITNFIFWKSGKLLCFKYKTLHAIQIFIPLFDKLFLGNKRTGSLTDLAPTRLSSEHLATVKDLN